MKFNPDIFRAYDIRGVVGRDFDSHFALQLGQAFAQKLNARLPRPQSSLAMTIKRGLCVAVGYDCRLTSLELAENLILGLTRSGVKVINLGSCPTPLLYFSLFQDEVAGGIMVTGSHNPSEYNGFKLCLGKNSLFGDSIQELKRIIELEEKEISIRGLARDDMLAMTTSRNPSIIESYQKYLIKHFSHLKKNKNKIKIVVDAGNGTAGNIAPAIFESLGFDVVPIYCEVDGRFPNHHPDPTIEENLKSLIKKVLLEKADLGIAFDGDSDRIGVVCDSGQIIWGDILLTLFSKEIFKEKGRVKVIGEVKCSNILFDEVRRIGGSALMWKTGHSFIKSKLKEEAADVAGEMSGHIFFNDRYFGYDDAIYAACRLLEILVDSHIPLSTIVNELPKTYSTPEIRVDSTDQKKFELVQSVKDSFSKNHTVFALDGVRISFPDGWALVRASNTQPVIVLRFEASSQKRLKEIQKQVQACLPAPL
ncbi:MAG: phosphomannomutase/phosphoglucomutase [Deltaproteobacteria bacterium]|nr:phosphomannomutase/phosphoglucomutase [Deltaproteobacteria bacterium]